MGAACTKRSQVRPILVRDLSEQFFNPPPGTHPHEIGSTYHGTPAASNPWMAHLTPHQATEIVNAFARFDRNGDGHIEARELKQVSRILGISVTDAQSAAMLKSVDDDGNGKVEFDEFAAMMARRMLTQENKLELDNAFKLFDPAGTGYVNAEFVRELMTSVGQPLSNSEVDEMLRLAKPDEDGNISLDVFRAMPCWSVGPLPDQPDRGAPVRPFHSGPSPPPSSAIPASATSSTTSMQPSR